MSDTPHMTVTELIVEVKRLAAEVDRLKARNAHLEGLLAKEQR